MCERLGMTGEELTERYILKRAATSQVASVKLPVSCGDSVVEGAGSGFPCYLGDRSDYLHGEASGCMRGVHGKIWRLYIGSCCSGTEVAGSLCGSENDSVCCECVFL